MNRMRLAILATLLAFGSCVAGVQAVPLQAVDGHVARLADGIVVSLDGSS